MINPLATKALSILAIAAVGFGAAWQLQNWRKNAEIDRLKADHAQAVAAAASEAKRIESEFRATEQKWQKELDNANTQLAANRKKNLQIAAGFERERNGLREYIKYYANGIESAQDTLNACRDRAGKLGGLLGESLQLQEELAGDAEREAGNARALQQAWPK